MPALVFFSTRIIANGATGIFFSFFVPRNFRQKSSDRFSIVLAECDLTFDHASTLYTHAAGKHYYNQGSIS
jgi:hypothetical protein